MASAINIDKSITLDLNTHTLSGDGVKDGFVIINAPNGDVTIKNGVLTLAGTSAYGYLISTKNKGNVSLTLEDLTASTAGSANIIRSYKGDSIHIVSGSYQCGKNTPISTAGDYLLEEGVTIISTDSSSGTPGGYGMTPWSIHNKRDHGNVEFAEGCYAAVVISPKEGRTLTVTRGEMPEYCIVGPHGYYTGLQEAVDAELTGPENVTFYPTGDGPEEDVVIPEGTSLTLFFNPNGYDSGSFLLHSNITVKGSLKYRSYGTNETGIVGTITVEDGGSFSMVNGQCMGVFGSDVSEYCPDGFGSSYNYEDGYWHVVHAAVAGTDNKTYGSIAAAVKAGEKNIKLTADWCENAVITLDDAKSADKITIDLNGHKLTGGNTGKNAVITVGDGVTLEIVGSTSGSKLQTISGYVKAEEYAVENHGNLTLTDVTIVGVDVPSHVSGGPVTSISRNALVRSNGTLTIKNGSINNAVILAPNGINHVGESAGECDGGIGVLIYGGTAAIDGTKIRAGYNGVYVEDGKLSITGSGTSIEWYVNSLLTPEANGRHVTAVDAASDDMISITGGSYNSNVSRFVPATHVAKGTGTEGDSCVVVPASEDVFTTSARIIFVKDIHTEGDNTYQIVLESKEAGKAIYGFKTATLGLKLEGDHHLTYKVVGKNNIEVSETDGVYTFTANADTGISGSRIVLGVVTFSGIGEGKLSCDETKANAATATTFNGGGDAVLSLTINENVEDSEANITAYGSNAPVRITEVVVKAGENYTDWNGTRFNAETDMTLTYDLDSGNITTLGKGSVVLADKADEITLNGTTYTASDDNVVLDIDDGTVTAGDGYAFEDSAEGKTPVRKLPVSDVTIPELQNGSVSVEPKSPVTEGNEVTLTVTPNDGYKTGKVTITDGNGEDVQFSQDGDEYTFTMPGTEVSVDVEFIKISSVTVNTSPVDGGKATADMDTDIEEGTEVTVNVVPNAGYVVDSVVAATAGGINVDFTSTADGKYTFDMPADDVTVTVRFAKLYSVAVSKTDGGSVVVSKSEDIKAGEEITFTVTPNEGYELSSVSVKASGADVPFTNTDDVYKFTMPESDATIDVVFAEIPEITEPPKIVDDPVVEPPVVSDNVKDIPEDYVAEALNSLDMTPDTEALQEIKETATKAAEAVTERQLSDAIEELGTGDNEQVYIHVLTTIETSVEAYQTSGSQPNILVLDITPYYRVVATTAKDSKDIHLESSAEHNAVEISSGETTITKSVKMMIPVPDGFIAEGDRIIVKHEHADGVFYYESEYAEGVVTFVNPHGFSKFTIIAVNSSTLSGLTVTPGTMNAFDPSETEYAVDVDNSTSSVVFTAETADGDADITAVSPSGAKVTVGDDGTITVEGLQVGDNVVTLTVTVGEGSEAESTVYTLTVHRNAPTTGGLPSGGSSSSGGSTGGTTKPAAYDIEATPCENADIEVTEDKVAPGTEVTVKVNAETGFDVTAVEVKTTDGTIVEVHDNGNGTFTFTMPAADVTVSVSTAVCPSLAYNDLDVSAWYHEYTNYVISHELMIGVGSDRFAPDGVVTRAQMVMVLWNLAGKAAVYNSDVKFADIPEDAWYAQAFYWAQNAGIVLGYGNDMFGPNDTLTREQMATMLFRYWQYTTGMLGFESAERLAFSDADRISDWAKTAVLWCVDGNIMEGVGNNTFNPDGYAKRVELAAILTRYDMTD